MKKLTPFANVKLGDAKIGDHVTVSLVTNRKRFLNLESINNFGINGFDTATVNEKLTFIPWSAIISIERSF